MPKKINGDGMFMIIYLILGIMLGFLLGYIFMYFSSPSNLHFKQIVESKVDDQTVVDMFCQAQQYKIEEPYECEVVESYHGGLEVCNNKCALLKALFDYGYERPDDCVDFSLEECFNECEEAYTYERTCYNTTYEHYTTGRYFEEFHDEKLCGQLYKTTCDRELKFGIECFDYKGNITNIKQELGCWITNTCSFEELIEACTEINPNWDHCNKLESQKYYWEDGKFE